MSIFLQHRHNVLRLDLFQVAKVHLAAAFVYSGTMLCFLHYVLALHTEGELAAVYCR